MKKPEICGSITRNDFSLIEAAEPLVDLFELRIDLVGDGWQEVAARLKKPWIACNRKAEEGGRGAAGEEERTAVLLQAVELGAAIVDVELASRYLVRMVKQIKKKAACLISHHDLVATPDLTTLMKIVQDEKAAGADICKVVTTAQRFDDNLTVLQLFKSAPGVRLVAFAMGSSGITSRVLSPLAGGVFTYASLGGGRESAPGQPEVRHLREMYRLMEIQ